MLDRQADRSKVELMEEILLTQKLRTAKLRYFVKYEKVVIYVDVVNLGAQALNFSNEVTLVDGLRVPFGSSTKSATVPSNSQITVTHNITVTLPDVGYHVTYQLSGESIITPAYANPIYLGDPNSVTILADNGMIEDTPLASLVDIIAPAKAAFGAVITIKVTLKNVGGVAGTLYAILTSSVAGMIHPEESRKTGTVSPSSTITLTWNISFYSIGGFNSVDFGVEFGHFDQASQIVDGTASFQILKGIPLAQIVSIDAPATSPAFQTVDVRVILKNIGDIAGTLHAYAIDGDTGDLIFGKIKKDNIGINQLATIVGSFLMPEKDVNGIVKAGHFELGG